MHDFEAKAGPETQAPVPASSKRPESRRDNPVSGVAARAGPAITLQRFTGGMTSGLRLGAAGQPAEREASGIADQVLSRDSAGPARTPAAVAPRPGAGGAQAPPIVHRVLARVGQPLEPATRAFMEPRFGRGFGEVRIHADGLAAESARAVNARAYAVGPDIVFNAGEYAPQSPAGKWLLAHELAHTVQQGGAGEPVLRRFESFEHIDLGDTSKGAEGKLILLSCHELDFGNRNGPEAKWSGYWKKRWAGYDKTQMRAAQKGLTYGEVVALVGDFYPSFAALDKASLGEVVALIPLIHKRPPATTAEFQKATGGRYAALATTNVVHFSGTPTKSEKAAWKKEFGVEISSNMDVWREQHRLAIGHARAGRANLAWGVNAAADHFLSDAFSAGHIRVPRAAMIGMSKSIESKVLHDLDNLFGLEVINAQGIKWVTYGDNHLHDAGNEAGLAMAMKAVELSKTDIAEALAGGKAYPDPGTIKGFAAEALVPKALPAPDRWTGRPKGGPPSLQELKKPTTHYSAMWIKLAKDESGYLVKNKTILDDVEVRDWVAGTEPTALARVTVFEKIRMLETLTGGIIDGIDLAAIEKIVDSVPTAAEMLLIRRWHSRTVINNPYVQYRISKAVSRTEFKR